MEKRLKIGFIVSNSKQLPAWYFETIKKVGALNIATFHFVITKDEKNQHPRKSSFAFRLFQKFEGWYFKSEHDASKPVNIENLINENNSTVISADQSFVIDEKDIRELRSKQLDIIYTVDFEDHKNENLSEVATYGLWYIKFGYEKYTDPALIGFWEVMDDCPMIGSYLLSRQHGEDKIIYDGTTTTVPYSVKNSFNSIAWKSASYLSHRIEGLLLEGEIFLSNLPVLWQDDHSRTKTSSNLHMSFLLLRNFFRYLIYKAEKVKEKKFTLLIGYNPFQITNTVTVQLLRLPKGSFFADPFVITRDNINYIFFEEFLSSKNKAHISVIEITEDKKMSLPKVVLDKPYHLSYPFVFCFDQEYYMVPETSCKKSVELYKAKKFPYEWEFVMYLIEDKTLIDVTLHFDNGLWWMFANSSDHPFVSTNDQLFLFYSDNLFSTNWKPHPQNPVATHINNCRPGGRLFRQNGKLYRPAQNNASKQYGHGLKLNEVMILNEHQFEEKEVYAFDNEKLNLKACHHMDFSSSIIVMDGIPK